MVIIKFPDGNIDWYKANWAFRRFAADILAAAPVDAEIHHAFNEAEAIGALFMDYMDVGLQSRALRVMKDVAEKTVERAVGLTDVNSNDEAERQYIRSIEELLELLKTRVP